MTDDTLTLPHRLIDEDGELLCADCHGNFSEAGGVLLPGDETGECGERWKAEYTARCRERDEAHAEVGRLQSALGGEITARLAAEAERDEAHLILAAEQGRPEGAPSEGWQFEEDCYRKRRWAKGTAECLHGRDGWKWRSGRKRFQPVPSARAAMIAADKAMETP